VTLTRPALRYHGGKWKLAPWIIEHLPPHRVYVEPYGGGASVLLRKPRSYAEVYNDMDDDLVNLFQVLRSSRLSARLMEQLRLTPYSRVEFQRSYRPAKTRVERARRAVVRSYMGFGSASMVCQHRTGFRASSHRSGTTPSGDWRNYADLMPNLIDRLRGVLIEHRPASAVIEHHDRADTLFYVDPPYVHSTRSFKYRKTGQVYAHEMTDEDHRALAEQLHGVRGMVVLSGYASDLYAELYRGWNYVAAKAHADGALDRVEVLWFNPAADRGRRQSTMFAEVA
jgi:DNA adenine methylase